MKPSLPRITQKPQVNSVPVKPSAYDDLNQEVPNPSGPPVLIMDLAKNENT